jgi:hypothetical protein
MNLRTAMLIFSLLIATNEKSGEEDGQCRKKDYE